MERERFVKLINEMLELPPGSLTGNESLADIESWDSMAVLNFLAMADSECGVSLSAKNVSSAKTLNDLLGLLSAA